MIDERLELSKMSVMKNLSGRVAVSGNITEESQGLRDLEVRSVKKYTPGSIPVLSAAASGRFLGLDVDREDFATPLLAPLCSRSP